jgi:membrane-associated protease RseP (regulator of RpoE activity)
VLVFVHELGHLVAAKSVDIEVPRFSIGFGPKIGASAGRDRVRDLRSPAGRLRPHGRDGGHGRTGGRSGAGARPPAATTTPSRSGRAIWVVSAGVLMNFLFAILVFAGVAFFYGDRLLNTTRVDISPEAAETEAARAARRHPPGRGAEGSGWDRGGELERRGRRALRRARRPADAGVHRCAARDAHLPGSDTARMAVLRLVSPFVPAVIGEISPGSAAARRVAYRRPRGGAAGEPIQSWSQFVTVVQAHPDQELPLEVVRER